MNLIATVIEVAQHDGYAIVRFQLAGEDGTATTGDCFGVAVEDASGYEVGQVRTITL
jgi:hypothetical protein